MRITALTGRSFILLRLIVVFTLVVFPLSLGARSIKADALTPIEDVIEDSRPSIDSNHTITFTTQTLVEDDGSTITVTFPASFDLTSVDHDDIDIEDDSTDKETAVNCAGSDEVSIVVAAQIITFTICSGDTGDITAGSIVVIEIGDHADHDGAGSDQINNHPTPAVYDITIGGTWSDDGLAKIVVVADLTARISVAETLTFTVGAVDAATCVDRDDQTNEVATTGGTLVDFGAVTTEQFYDACHLLTVGTNATAGYGVTVTESDQLSYGGDQIADGACDAACTETTAAIWTTQTINGFGYCLDDLSGDAAATADAGMIQCATAGVEFKIFPELDDDSPEFEAIMSSVAELSANDTTYLGYRLTVPGSTPAGTYENNIILVATPLY